MTSEASDDLGTMFTYGSGESWNTFNDNNFTPKFFSSDLTELFPDFSESQVCS